MTMDRKSGPERSRWERARNAETHYARQLRKVARHIDDIIKGFAFDDIAKASSGIWDALHRYATLLTPWAEAVGERMVAEVASRDKQAWRAVSAEMGATIKRELDTAPVGVRTRKLMAEQVSLITSLPIEAAQRVHGVAIEGLSTGTRASTIAEDILRTGAVTKSRATLIARTEIGRAATALTQARAEHIGSTHFIWRTAEDSDVRDTHRALNGKSFRWDAPPECDPGHRALPGSIWNCRCFAEPILPD